MRRFLPEDALLVFEGVWVMIVERERERRVGRLVVGKKCRKCAPIYVCEMGTGCRLESQRRRVFREWTMCSV